MASKDHSKYKLKLFNFTSEDIFLTCWLFLQGYICFQGTGDKQVQKKKEEEETYCKQASGEVWSREIVRVLEKEILRLLLWCFTSNEILIPIY